MVQRGPDIEACKWSTLDIEGCNGLHRVVGLRRVVKKRAFLTAEGGWEGILDLKGYRH